MEEKQRARVSLLPADLTPERVRVWIRELAEALDITPTELARRAQIAQTTINRFLSGKSKNKNLTASTIYSISSVAKQAILSGNAEQVPRPVDERLERLRKLRDEGELDFIKFHKGHYLVTFTLSGLVGKGIEAGSLDKKNDIEDFKFTIPLSNPIYNYKPFAYELREQHNQKFQDGTFLICVRFADYKFRRPFEDDATVLRIAEDAKGVHEGLVYTLTKDPKDHWWMIPTHAEARPSEHVYVGSDFVAGISALGPDVFLVVATIRQEAEVI